MINIDISFVETELPIFLDTLLKNNYKITSVHRIILSDIAVGKSRDICMSFGLTASGGKFAFTFSDESSIAKQCYAVCFESIYHSKKPVPAPPVTPSWFVYETYTIGTPLLALSAPWHTLYQQQQRVSSVSIFAEPKCVLPNWHGHKFGQHLSTLLYASCRTRPRVASGCAILITVYFSVFTPVCVRWFLCPVRE